MVSVLDRLTSLERELRDVDAMLADPDVFSDQSRFVMLSKRRKELEPIVERSQELRQVTEDLETAKEMFAELAGDDRETMRAEVDGAEQRIEELEGEIKVLLIPRDPNDDRNVIIEIRGAEGGEEEQVLRGRVGPAGAPTASSRMACTPTAPPARGAGRRAPPTAGRAPSSRRSPPSAPRRGCVTVRRSPSPACR